MGVDKDFMFFFFFKIVLFSVLNWVICGNRNLFNEFEIVLVWVVYFWVYIWNNFFVVVEIINYKYDICEIKYLFIYLFIFIKYILKN